MKKFLAGLVLSLGFALPAYYLASPTATTAAEATVSAELEAAIAANNAAGESAVAVNELVVALANEKQCSDEAIYESYCKASEVFGYAVALTKLAEFDALVGDEADAIKNLTKSTKLLGVAEVRLTEVLAALKAYTPTPAPGPEA